MVPINIMLMAKILHTFSVQCLLQTEDTGTTVSTPVALLLHLFACSCQSSKTSLFHAPQSTLPSAPVLFRCHCGANQQSRDKAKRAEPSAACLVCQTLSWHAHSMGPTSWSGMPLAIHLEQQQRDKVLYILPGQSFAVPSGLQ